MSWDYGVRDQVSEEYSDAVKAGMCHLCIIRKANPENKPCDKCQNDIADAKERESMAEYFRPSQVGGAEHREREDIALSGTVQAAACPWCDYVWRLELLQGYTPRSEAPAQMCIADSFLGGHDAHSMAWAREHGFRELKLMSPVTPIAPPRVRDAVWANDQFV